MGSLLAPAILGYVPAAAPVPSLVFDRPFGVQHPRLSLAQATGSFHSVTLY